MITRRGFWGRLVGGGAAVVLAPAVAAPADPPRGLVYQPNYCPFCAHQPNQITALRLDCDAVTPAERMQRLRTPTVIACQNTACAKAYLAQFMVDV